MIQKRARGRPRHQPTEATREDVKKFAVGGALHEDIATVIGIDLKTLYRHYRRELDFGQAATKLLAAGQLHKAIARGDAWAICFFMKCKGGFSEAGRNREAGPPLPSTESLIAAQSQPIPAQLSQTINAEDAMREYMQLMRPKAPALPQLAAPVSQQ